MFFSHRTAASYGATAFLVLFFLSFSGSLGAADAATASPTPSPTTHTSPTPTPSPSTSPTPAPIVEVTLPPIVVVIATPTPTPTPQVSTPTPAPVVVSQTSTVVATAPIPVPSTVVVKAPSTPVPTPSPTSTPSPTPILLAAIKADPGGGSHVINPLAGMFAPVLNYSAYPSRSYSPETTRKLLELAAGFAVFGAVALSMGLVQNIVARKRRLAGPTD